MMRLSGAIKMIFFLFLGFTLFVLFRPMYWSWMAYVKPLKSAPVGSLEHELPRPLIDAHSVGVEMDAQEAETIDNVGAGFDPVEPQDEPEDEHQDEEVVGEAASGVPSEEEHHVEEAVGEAASERPSEEDEVVEPSKKEALRETSAEVSGEDESPVEPATTGTKVGSRWTRPKAVAKPLDAPFNADDHLLTPEKVKPYLRENIVMVTWGNDHYLDFIKNWVSSLRKLNVTNFMVGAMDDPLLRKLLAEGIPTFAMASGLTTEDFGWGSPNFHKMGRKKIDLIRQFTVMGYDILVSDVDTVWMRDPIPYMQQYKDADVLTSSDHLSTSAMDGGLEVRSRTHSPANIGIMLFRHTAKELAKEWVEMIEANDKLWDQNAFNTLMGRGGNGKADPETRLFMGYKGTMKMGILPVGLFCSGHTYFVQKMHEKYKLDPYVVHATFQFSGTEGKRHRMREAKLWVDSEEYYNRPGGYLVYEPRLDPEMVKNSGSVEGHFTLTNYQIQQVRAALQISMALGRALVMPKLWCGFDRWWAPHKGKIPNSDMILPYHCPMDHIFQVETWERKLEERHFGKNTEFVEHSFLENPRVPATVKTSKLRVKLCQAGEDDCSKMPQATSGANAVRVQEGLTDAELVKAFSQYSSQKVLAFDSMSAETFGGYADPKDLELFKKRTIQYAGLWCCIHAHPGHIWYDFWWDDIPHKDRHNRLWETPWVPKAGP